LNHKVQNLNQSPQLLILIPNIADKIIKNGADYILAVKANQEA
jgi:hypothetical protein